MTTTPQPAPVKPVPTLEMAIRVADEYCEKDSQIDSGNLYAALRQCLDYIAQLEQPATTPKPAQAEPMASPYVTQAQLDRAFPAPVAQEGDAKDAERLDWLLHNLSGKALRDVKVIADSGGLYFGRIAIDKAIASQKASK